MVHEWIKLSDLVTDGDMIERDLYKFDEYIKGKSGE